MTEAQMIAALVLGIILKVSVLLNFILIGERHRLKRERDGYRAIVDARYVEKTFIHDEQMARVRKALKQ